MAQEKMESFLIDRGGMRRIKDRRFQVSTTQISERRTGLRRRNGLDRRYREVCLFKGPNRRMESKVYLE